MCPIFREIPSIQLCLLPFVEEIRHGYRVGHPVRDHSLPVDSPDRDFLQHSCLLFGGGDNPGQAKLAAQTRAGFMACPHCFQYFEKILGTSGCHCAINNRAATPRDHPVRDDRRLGSDSANPARNEPPKLRTHEEEVQLGLYMYNYGSGTRISEEEYERLKKESGRRGFCVFALIDMFNTVEDFLLDWMHIMKGVSPLFISYVPICV